MWTTSISDTTALSPSRVWRALEALHTGALTYPGADRFELHGPFAEGTELDITPEGQDAFRSTITELVENEVYADRTEYQGLVLTFRHTLTPEGSGTRVTHTLEITGDAADEVGPELGLQISGDFDVSMAALLSAAAKLAE